MNWREPWSASIKQQPKFSLLTASFLKSALACSAPLLVMMIVVNLGEDLHVQLERAAGLWLAPALGVLLAASIYSINWLSPREISFGPNGIVITKGQQISLIPWQTIAQYDFGTTSGRNLFSVVEGSGASHTFQLSAQVRPKDIERELQRHGQTPQPASQEPRGASAE